MGLIHNFKRDIVRHRGRSSVLGILFVTMIAFSVRAFLQLRPQPLPAAIPMSMQNSLQTPVEAKTVASIDAQSRIKESQQLWAKLHEIKSSAVMANAAFAFDPSFYPPPPPDLTRKNVVVAETEIAKPVSAPLPVVDSEAIKMARVKDQARALVVKSTAVGEGVTQPVAIVNQQLLAVGQQILGFTITAIRAREVEFSKEGVSVVVAMP